MVVGHSSGLQELASWLDPGQGDSSRPSLYKPGLRNHNRIVFGGDVVLDSFNNASRDE